MKLIFIICKKQHNVYLFGVIYSLAFLASRTVEENHAS